MTLISEASVSHAGPPWKHAFPCRVTANLSLKRPGPTPHYFKSRINFGPRELAHSRAKSWTSTLKFRHHNSVVHARGGDLDIQDRVLGALPYLIPLLDGIRYGRYFFLQFPFAAQVLAPLRPLINIYYSVPFLSLIIFFGLYSGVVNNFSFARHVRFNAMQAILLSVLLVFPSLVEQIFRSPLGGPGLQIQISLYNTIWLFVATCVVYGSGSSLLGRVARLPLISDAADQRVM